MEDKWRTETSLRGERENRMQDERDKEEMEGKLHAIRTKAAVRIQSVWRGVLLRRAIAGGGKKGKGAKKGGKKKK